MRVWQEIDLRSDSHEAAYHRDPADLFDALGELLALARRPWWHAHAACRGQGPSAWWPERGVPVEPLRATCAGCPVAAECRADALSRSGPEDGGGIWGGTSARERKRLRRSVSTAA